MVHKSCWAAFCAATLLLSACRDDAPVAPPPAASTPTHAAPARTSSGEEIVAAEKEAQLMLLSYVYTQDEQRAQPAATRLTALEKAEREQLQGLLRVAPDETQRRIVAQLGESVDNYWHAVEETMRMKRNQQDQLAEATLFGLVSQYAAEQEQILRRLDIERRRQNS